MRSRDTLESRHTTDTERPAQYTLWLAHTPQTRTEYGRRGISDRRDAIRNGNERQREGAQSAAHTRGLAVDGSGLPSGR